MSSRPTRTRLYVLSLSPLRSRMVRRNYAIITANRAFNVGTLHEKARRLYDVCTRPYTVARKFLKFERTPSRVCCRKTLFVELFLHQSAHSYNSLVLRPFPGVPVGFVARTNMIPPSAGLYIVLDTGVRGWFTPPPRLSTTRPVFSLMFDPARIECSSELLRPCAGQKHYKRNASPSKLYLTSNSRDSISEDMGSVRPISYNILTK